MTDWIHQLFDGLDATQQDQNRQHATRLRHARVISETAPRFLEALGEAVRRLGEELNATVGASLGDVKVETPHPGWFVVSSSSRLSSCSVSSKFNPRKQQIAITTTRKGPQFVRGDGGEKVFKFRITEEDRLIATGGPESYEDPETMAAALLQAAFTAELLTS